MAKRGSPPSAASFVKTSVSLSRSVEKTFALEAEVSRLRHHVSVLSRRLHKAQTEIAVFESSCRAGRTACSPGEGVVVAPPIVEVAEEVVALVPVAPPVVEVAEEVVALVPVAPPVVEVAGVVVDADVVLEDAPPAVRPLGLSSDEDVVLGGVIVAGGASARARKRRSGRKRKGKGTPAVEVGGALVPVVSGSLRGGDGGLVPPGGFVAAVGAGVVEEPEEVIPAHFCPVQEFEREGAVRLLWSCPCGGSFSTLVGEEDWVGGALWHVEDGSGRCDRREEVMDGDGICFGPWDGSTCGICWDHEGGC